MVEIRKKGQRGVKYLSNSTTIQKYFGESVELLKLNSCSLLLLNYILQQCQCHFLYRVL